MVCNLLFVFIFVWVIMFGVCFIIFCLFSLINFLILWCVIFIIWFVIWWLIGLSCFFKLLNDICIVKLLFFIFNNIWIGVGGKKCVRFKFFGVCVFIIKIVLSNKVFVGKFLLINNDIVDLLILLEVIKLILLWIIGWFYVKNLSFLCINVNWWLKVIVFFFFESLGKLGISICFVGWIIIFCLFKFFCFILIILNKFKVKFINCGWLFCLLIFLVNCWVCLLLLELSFSNWLCLCFSLVFKVFWCLLVFVINFVNLFVCELRK